MSSPNFRLSSGSLGYWTVCNNFKRYCTLPYCDISVWRDLVDYPVVWCHSQSPDLTSHDPITWNTLFCVLCHLSCGYPRSCVSSLPRRWSGVHIRQMNCTPLPATQEWKWAGLKWISKWEVWPPLHWSLTFCFSWGASQTLYWGTPLQKWWKNVSLWGVKVGIQSVAWWAVCHRNRLPLWGGVTVGAWVTIGACHGLCVLNDFGYQSQIFRTLVLVCRLVNATTNHTNMSMSGQNSKSTPCLPSTPNKSESPDAVRDTLPSPKHRQTFFQIPCGWRTWPKQITDQSEQNHPNQEIDGTTSESVKRAPMGRALLVEVNHEAYSTNLLKLDKIDMPVRVSAHRILNFSKGVVRFKQAATDLTNEDMAETWTCHGGIETYLKWERQAGSS